MSRTNYEERFYLALKRITSYMTPALIRRTSEREYGLDHAEALEMAYENVIEEAKSALRGYRKPRAGTVQPQEPIMRATVVAALQHTSRVDTERILGRLGFSEQEIADAIR